MQAIDIMTADPISVEPNASVMQAVRLMLQHRISCLPVVAASGTLIGIITEGDLLKRAEAAAATMARILQQSWRKSNSCLWAQGV